MFKLNLNLIIEQVILESLILDKIKDIFGRLKKLKKDFDLSKKMNSSDKAKLKENLSNFILNRIELRYELADVVKNKPILKGGKKIESEKDLDEYIFNMDKTFPDLILIHSSLLPNPQENFQGLL